MNTRNVVFPAGRQALYEKNHYSPAVRAGDLLFVSGQVGAREDGSVQQGAQAQIRQAFENLQAILHAAGGSFDDVIDVTMFVVDPQDHLDSVMTVMPEFWGQAPYPSLTAVGVTWLSGFIFEIKVVARLPVAA